MKKNVCKRKREKRKLFSRAAVLVRQKANGINETQKNRGRHSLCRSLFAPYASRTTDASFAFAFARISYKTALAKDVTRHQLL